MKSLIPFILLLLRSLVIAAQQSPQADLDNIRLQFYHSQDSLLDVYGNVSGKLDIAGNPPVKQDPGLRQLQLNNAIKVIWERRLRSEFDLVKHNPGSLLSLDILHEDLWRPEASAFYDTLDSLFGILIPGIQNSIKGRQMLEDLFNCKSSLSGKAAPAFTVKDKDGIALSLSDFCDKNYVLLDFWASWCVPCREDFPFLRKIYNQYHSHGLEIVGISIDQDLQLWRKAILQDSLVQWRHIAAQESQPSIASQYFVIGVPLKVLIDRQGQIIGRWVGDGEENREDIKKVLHGVYKKDY